MRRPVHFVTAIGTAVALALPGVSAAQGVQDSVVGSGTTDFSSEFSFAFDLNARSGPSGENPTGTAKVVLRRDQTFGIDGPVTCLNVTGNRAVIGLDNSQGVAGLARGWFIEVTDDIPDSLAISVFSPVAAPTGCPASLGLGQQRVDSGDIVVTDAQPFPTSKDECKNGGWRAFPSFKNQGDCVSFVATGGKSPPGNGP